jgi:hypothetical protein
VPATVTEKWVASDVGALLRRGREPRGDLLPPPGIIDQNFETIAVAATLGTNPAGVAAFREIVGDPAYGYIQAQHDHMAIVDLGESQGRTLRVRYDDGWYQSASNNGIAYMPVLPRPVEAVTVSFWLRFNSGFTSGKGGKFGPGIGWGNRHRGPAAGGSTTQPHAGSFRMMWRDDFRVSPYIYDANATNGVGLATSPASPTYPADHDWHFYEYDIVMNTANIDSGPVGETPPSVLEGSHYLPDGVLACRVDSTTIYNSSTRVHRKYSDTMFTHLLWSWFRGGGDSTWDVTGGPGYMDMSEYTVEEIIA